MGTIALYSLSEIEMVVRRLGVSGSYCGLPHLIRAVALVLKDPEAVSSAGKLIYAPLAQECGITPSVLERRIRIVRDHIWDYGNRGLLDEMARFDLAYPPTATELIDYIAHFIRRQH